MAPCGEKREHTQSSLCAPMTGTYCQEDSAALLSGDCGQGQTHSDSNSLWVASWTRIPLYIVFISEMGDCQVLYSFTPAGKSFPKSQPPPHTPHSMSSTILSLADLYHPIYSRSTTADDLRWLFYGKSVWGSSSQRPQEGILTGDKRWTQATSHTSCIYWELTSECYVLITFYELGTITTLSLQIGSMR